MTIRITWRRLLLGLTALAVAGLLFAWSGLFNVAASTGHWKITDWALHWVMRNSVRTHAAFTAPADPIATDGHLVSAAGHFASACASCHGAPGVRPSPVMQRATPPAPDLAVNAKEWSDAQIFWILRHGVKYTGMPAWAADGRDDEIRRMVAFVRRLPQMTPAAYTALTGEAAGTATVGVRGVADGVVAGCAACHGADGRGRGQPDIPVLGGQRPEYLAAALRAYATGRRQSAVMANAAAALDDAEMAALARHFAAMPGLSAGDGAAAPREDAAARIVTHGLPDRELPSCRSCHDDRPGGRYPRLHGQKPAYVAQRLRNWHGADGVVEARLPQGTMPVIARRIPEDLIDPVAAAVAGPRR